MTERQRALIERAHRVNPTHSFELHPSADAIRCKGCGAEISGESIAMGQWRIDRCKPN